MTVFFYSFKKYTCFKENYFSLKIFSIFSFKNDSMTLDPDPNWAKILDPDPNTLTLSKYRGQFRYKCYAEIPIIIGTVL